MKEEERRKEVVQIIRNRENYFQQRKGLIEEPKEKEK